MDLLKRAEALKEKESNLLPVGMDVNFISLAQKSSRVVDPDSEHRIEGLNLKEFYSFKLNKGFGSSLKVVPLAFISVYNHFSSADADANFIGVIHEEDAIKLPKVKGSFSDRQVADGSILQPVTWVCVKLVDFPEIENAVITFKKGGLKIAKEWAKVAGDKELPASMQIYEVVADVNTAKKEGKEFSWYVMQPNFKGFTVIEKDGKVIQAPYAEEVVNLSEKLLDDYIAGTLIRRQELTAETVEQNFRPETKRIASGFEDFSTIEKDFNTDEDEVEYSF